MPPIVSVSTSNQSAPWGGHAQALGLVRSGLRDARYIVLNVDQDVSLAAQGTQLAYYNLTSHLDPAAAVPGLRRLPHKILLDFTTSQAGAPALVEPWLPRVADSFCDIADAMLRLCLEALGMPSNALANILDASPPIPGVAPASLLQASSYNRQQGIIAETHTDRSLLTVVWESSPGLEVLSSAGTWQPVALGPNQVAVFAGETLEHATAGAIHAALHRVSQREARSVPRVSLAYKQRPAPYAIIDMRNVPNFVPNNRYTQPLAVSHATALFEATHRSINQLQPAAAASAGNHIVDAHEEQELQRQAARQRQGVGQQEGARQQQAAEQQQGAAGSNARRRPLPEDERAPPPSAQRVRSSPESGLLQLAALREATTDPQPQPQPEILLEPKPEPEPVQQAPGDAAEKQTVRIRTHPTRTHPTGFLQPFNVPRTMTVQRLIKAYSRLLGLDWYTVRFVIDGFPLGHGLSIAQCDLQHMDVVDAFLEQSGD